jgi:putative FmdB family regulatory protein
MPIYEYACASCGAKEERIQPVSAPEAHDCPTCSASSGMQRLVSRTAFILSGGGWYAGGYGEGPAKQKEAAPAGAAKAEAAGSAGEAACPGPGAATPPAPSAAAPDAGNTGLT